MKCPLDGTALQMTERKGVEIDYCPQCRGVWLDRGELDKMIEQSSAQPQAFTPAPVAPPQPQQHVQPQYREDRHHNDYRRHDDHKYHHKKKRESFLSEIFDF